MLPDPDGVHFCEPLYIVSQVAPAPRNMSEEEQLELKRQSDARAAGWPDTLQVVLCSSTAAASWNVQCCTTDRPMTSPVSFRSPTAIAGHYQSITSAPAAV